jgi:hypothetical protein
MKTNTFRSKLIAGAAGLAFAATAAFADQASAVAPANNTSANVSAAQTVGSDHLAQRCTDSRVISVKEAKWVPGRGRGMIIVDAGKQPVCNSCASPVAAARLTDRNSHGAKANKPGMTLHDCTPKDCGAALANAK